MKTLKALLIVIITLVSANIVNAQVTVRARVGAPAPRRVVVVQRPPVRHRTVVVNRPPVRRVVVNRPHRYRRVVTYRRYYANNGWHRRPVYRYYYR